MFSAPVDQVPPSNTPHLHRSRRSKRAPPEQHHRTSIRYRGIQCFSSITERKDVPPKRPIGTWYVISSQGATADFQIAGLHHVPPKPRRRMPIRPSGNRLLLPAEVVPHITPMPHYCRSVRAKGMRCFSPIAGLQGAPQKRR